MNCYAIYSYLTELWDYPFAGHLPYCSCAIIDKHLCQLDCRLRIVKKYITVFYMLYILGVHISACCFTCNFPGANKEITLFGHRQSCLVSFCGESAELLSNTKPLVTPRISLCHNSHATNNNTSDSDKQTYITSHCCHQCSIGLIVTITCVVICSM